jgi:hypothetical protein
LPVRHPRIVPALPGVERTVRHGGEDGKGASAARRVSCCAATSLKAPAPVLALVVPEKRRASWRYKVDLHAPHHYIAALRPNDRVTEFGD